MRMRSRRGNTSAEARTDRKSNKQTGRGQSRQESRSSLQLAGVRWFGCRVVLVVDGGVEELASAQDATAHMLRRDAFVQPSERVSQRSKRAVPVSNM